MIVCSLLTKSDSHGAMWHQKMTVTGIEMSIRSILYNTKSPGDIVFHYIGDAPLPAFPEIDLITLKSLRRFNLTRFQGRFVLVVHTAYILLTVRCSGTPLVILKN